MMAAGRTIRTCILLCSRWFDTLYSRASDINNTCRLNPDITLENSVGYSQKTPINGLAYLGDWDARANLRNRHLRTVRAY